MDARETNKILAMILEIYPSFGKDRNPEITSKLWQKLFESEPYEWVEKALMAFVATDTKGFPPTPGAIKEKIIQLMEKEEPTELEAWGKVLKAISNSTYNSGSEFAKLPKEIQEIVGSSEQLHQWALMYEDDVNTVVASNFQRSYRARSESRKMMGLLPDSFRISLPKEDTKKIDNPAPLLEDGSEEMPKSMKDVLMKLVSGV